MVKRLIDVLVSVVGLTFMFPFFLLISIVKSLSLGSVFYPKVEKDGKLFKLFKFRLMRMDGDQATAITVGQLGPRITKAGYFFDSTSLMNYHNY